MHDLEDRLKELGNNVATQAPSELHPTSQALRRIRVGRAIRGGAVMATVAAVAIAGFVGTRSLSSEDAAPIPPAEKNEERDRTLVDFPELTTTFVSPRNGFSVKHPESAAVTPAKQLWGFGKQIEDGFDVVDTGSGAVFKAASAGSGFGDSGSIDDRVDQYLARDLPGRCDVPRSQQGEITIDGQPGKIAECPNRIEATVVTRGRLYVFTLLHDREDGRAVFDAFAATIDLTPETAVDFPAMTTTFVSPTYGYSFKYVDRGGADPATEVWDPVKEQRDIGQDPRFDAVETGLGAYFEAASTPIQDGVAIDEWVDEHTTPPAAGGCGVPRSQQEEIIIDGQPGRIAECGHIQATVVAGGRLYLFTLFHSRVDAREWFDAWVGTIDLTPDTAAVR
jgi:hypothetical protein